MSRVSIEFGRSLLRAMKHILVRTACAVVSFVTLLQPTMAEAGDHSIVIRVYDMATSDGTARAAALRTAGDAIASAGVAVRWQDCSRGGAHHPCRTVRDAGELVVRVMPVSSGATDTGATELGFAPVDRAGHATVMATVFYDVVRRVSTRTGLDASELLGRAIAHEIGHLLLRAPGHGESGLMRPLWTDAELTQNRPGDWTFSDAERRQLQVSARAASADDAPAAGGDVEAAGR